MMWLGLVGRLPPIMERMFVIIWPLYFFFSSRRRHTRFDCDWSSDVCSSDLDVAVTDPRGRTSTLVDGFEVLAPIPDAGPPDAGPPDAGPPDAGPPDGGIPDAGSDRESAG